MATLTVTALRMDADRAAGVEFPHPVAHHGAPGLFRMAPIAELIESGHNPRRHFDEAKMADLTNSVRERGVLEPLVVREIGLGSSGHAYEIVAGARRYRAAMRAGLEVVPCIVRDYSDEEVLEIFIIENVQRDDLAPLEQARGFRALMDANPDRYTLQTLATRVGMSPAWVWDRLRLLDLIPEAAALLDANRMGVGHAIAIARLKPEDQRRAIKPRGGHVNDKPGGLWQEGTSDALLAALEDDARDPYANLKPVTVRELERWIDHHVRFDVAHAAEAVPLEFADTAAVVAEAQAAPGRGRKVISITFEYYVHPDARDEKDRTYGSQSFRLVEGDPCEHAILGVVVAGDMRGETKTVCIARDRCRVHWGKEIAAKEKAAKQRAAGNPKEAKRTDDAEAKRAERERVARAREEARWSLLYPKWRRKAHAAAAALPAGKPLTKKQFAAVLVGLGLPPKTKPADLARAALAKLVREQFNEWAWAGKEKTLRVYGEALGVDAKALEPTPAEIDGRVGRK